MVVYINYKEKQIQVENVKSAQKQKRRFVEKVKQQCIIVKNLLKEVKFT